MKIRRYLEHNAKDANAKEEQINLLNDLPPSLRSQVVKHTHGDIIEKINFLRDKDPDMLWQILPHLRQIQIMPKDVLYVQGDHSDEIYFILKGRLKLYVECGDQSAG